MNMRSPTVTLTEDESRRVRELARVRGTAAAAQLLGLADVRTLRRAGFGDPIARLTAEVLRGRLDRI